jgi:hypothetical protein
MNLGFLRPLYDNYGDYVSVYLDVDRAREDGGHAVELRWRSGREQLASQGADPATLDAVAEVVTDPANAGSGIAVFARQGTVRLRAALRAAPRREISRLAALPHIMPMLAQRPAQVPHLRVTANREGGEILVRTGDAIADDEQVRGHDWPVHKSPSGGWSQLSHQRSVEHTWDENAKELARQVTEAAAGIGAERIIVAGDVRTRALLLDHLSPPLREAVVLVDREVPAGDPATAEMADEIIDAQLEQAARDRFSQWHEQLARGLAVEGLADTTAALADGRAAAVFIADEPGSTAEAWVGPEGTDLALTARRLTGRGVSDPVTERADAAIARAVACTDAELFFLPGDVPEPRDGIGASLRYAG